MSLPSVITVRYSGCVTVSSALSVYTRSLEDGGTLSLFSFNRGSDRGPSSNRCSTLPDIVALLESTRDGKAYNPCLC